MQEALHELSSTGSSPGIHACGHWRLQPFRQCRWMKQEATGTFVYALRNGIIILIPHLFRKHMCRHKTISRGLIKGAVRPRLFKAVGCRCRAGAAFKAVIPAKIKGKSFERIAYPE